MFLRKQVFTVFIKVDEEVSDLYEFMGGGPSKSHDFSPATKAFCMV